MNNKCDHYGLGIQPSHSPLQQQPAINDELPNRIMNGTVIIKPNVDHFTKSGVVFDDGTSVSDLDVVIFATGYNIGFSFIDKSIIPVDNNDVTLYKYVFPPQLTKSTLAVIGCIQPIGAINAPVELQCRWVTRVFKGILKLPTESEMMNDIDKKKEESKKRFYASRRNTIEVNINAVY
jgi:dimethylaniline monooxygenase (N-oxide forming)